MNTPDSHPPQEGSVDAKAESSKASRMDEGMIDFASSLDDFMDEEVLDENGIVIGTLACYWQSASGLLVFLGIKVKAQPGVRVVPGNRSQVDDRDACIRLGFDASDVESAPLFDCATELDANLERTVYKHFGIPEVEPHGGLRYFAGKS